MTVPREEPIFGRLLQKSNAPLAQEMIFMFLMFCVVWCMSCLVVRCLVLFDVLVFLCFCILCFIKLWHFDLWSRPCGTRSVDRQQKKIENSKFSGLPGYPDYKAEHRSPTWQRTRLWWQLSDLIGGSTRSTDQVCLTTYIIRCMSLIDLLIDWLIDFGKHATT